MKQQLLESYKFCQNHPLFLGSNITIKEFHESALRSLAGSDAESSRPNSRPNTSSSNPSPKANSPIPEFSRHNTNASGFSIATSLATNTDYISTHAPEYTFKYYAKNEIIKLQKAEILICYSGQVSVVVDFDDVDRAEIKKYNRETEILHLKKNLGKKSMNENQIRLLSRQSRDNKTWSKRHGILKSDPVSSNSRPISGQTARTNFSAQTSNTNLSRANSSYQKMRNQNQNLEKIAMTRVKSAPTSNFVSRSNSGELGNFKLADTNDFNIIENKKYYSIATLISGNVYNLTNQFKDPPLFGG